MRENRKEEEDKTIKRRRGKRKRVDRGREEERKNRKETP